MKKQNVGFLLVLLLLASSRAAKFLTLAKLRELARAAGFPDPILAAAVAMAESGGNARAMGDFGLGPGGRRGAFGFTSFGLWQIHTPDHPEFRSVDLFDPLTNAKAALAISKNGAKWSDWSTFNHGDHLKYMSP